MNLRRGTAVLLAVSMALLGLAAILLPGLGSKGATLLPKRTGSSVGGRLDLPTDAALRGNPLPTVADASGSNLTPTDSVSVIQGVVQCAESGEAIAEALVFLDAGGTGEVNTNKAVRSDADGVFELPRVAEIQLVEAVAAGYVPATVDIPNPAGDVDLVIQMESGWNVAGVVLDDLEDPVPGALVWAALPSNRAAWPYPTHTLLSGGRSAGSSTRTDEAGRFRLSGLRAGEEYVVQCAKAGWTPRGYDSPQSTVARTRAGDDRIVLRLRPYGGVRVGFVDADNGARICPYLVQQTPARGLLPTWARPPWSALAGELPDLSLGPYSCFARDGTRFVDLDEPPLVELLVRATGYEETSYKFRVEFGAFRTIKVPVTPIKRGGTRAIRFSATLCNSMPYTGPLSLRVTRADLGGSDARGGGAIALDFTEGVANALVSVPTGSWWIHPAGAGTQAFTWIQAGEPVQIAVEPGAEPADVGVNVRGAPYFVRVLDASGKKVSGYNLTVIRGRDRMRRDVWDVRALAESAPSPLDAPASLPAEPPMWLSPGRTDLYFRTPEGGRGSVTVDCPGDGHARALQIVLRN